MYKLYRNVYDYEHLWFNIIHTLSFNKSKIIVQTNRNIGKTYGTFIWRILAGVRHNKETLWLRTFKDEVTTAMNDSIDPKMLAMIGLHPEDFKLHQKWLYYKDKPIIKFAKLSDAVALKGSNRPNMNCIIYDEFSLPIAKQRLYRGDIGADLDSIYKSIRRQKKDFHMVLFGNKEAVDSPIFHQYGLKPLQEDFEGIAVKIGGDILIEQINTIPEPARSAMVYDVDSKDIDYLQRGAVHNVIYTRIVGHKEHTPMFGLDVSGYKLTIAEMPSGELYIRTGYNPNAISYRDYESDNRFALRLTSDVKINLRLALLDAIRENDVVYKDAESWEGFQIAIDKLRI